MHALRPRASASTVVPWIMAKCSRAALASNGLGAKIYKAVEAGEATEEEAALLVRSFLSAGLDTTVAAISSALYLLATNPGEWRKFRADPSLAKNVFEETVRIEITDPREVELGGLRIPASEKVLLLLASANRDPEHWQEPDRFDPTRRIQGHVGFGVGFHACIGQVIARMEGELLLTALAQRRLDRAGRPADAPYQQRRPRLREPAARGAGGLKEKGARASGHTCFSDISARS